jgi:hypothetical protein
VQNGNGGDEALDFGADLAPRREADVFVGEIDLDFEMRANRYDLGAKLGDARGKCARELLYRDRQCAVAARGDNIGDGLGLGEIDLAVQKRAAGEFPRLGYAGARVECERHDAANNEWTPVALDFGYILARQAGRTAHHDRERAIDASAACGIDDVAQAHRSGRKFGRMHGAEDRVEDFQCARTGQADDRDGADSRRSGRRYDRVGGVHREI